MPDTIDDIIDEQHDAYYALLQALIENLEDVPRAVRRAFDKCDGIEERLAEAYEAEEKAA
jgi:hypothetical protein